MGIAFFLTAKEFQAGAEYQVESIGVFYFIGE
jgi:hypothetical protein